MKKRQQTKHTGLKINHAGTPKMDENGGLEEDFSFSKQNNCAHVKYIVRQTTGCFPWRTANRRKR